MGDTRLLTPRDWQAIAQRQATELLGSPEGADKLAEAKRYGMLADYIKELEAKLEAAEKAAAAKERERCAKICDSAVDECIATEARLGAAELLAKLALVAASKQAEKLAAAIRALPAAASSSGGDGAAVECPAP